MAEEIIPIIPYAVDVSHHRIVVLLPHFLKEPKEANKIIAEEIPPSERRRKRSQGKTKYHKQVGKKAFAEPHSRVHLCKARVRKESKSRAQMRMKK